MCDFSGNFYNYLEWDNIKLDEIIILCPLHLPFKDCEKFVIMQDVDTDQKFYEKVVELWNYEKEKEDILTKIEKDRLLYEKVKAIVVTHK
jgi:hypothetical protein